MATIVMSQWVDVCSARRTGAIVVRIAFPLEQLRMFAGGNLLHASFVVFGQKLSHLRLSSAVIEHAQQLCQFVHDDERRDAPKERPDCAHPGKFGEGM